VHFAKHFVGQVALGWGRGDDKKDEQKLDEQKREHAGGLQVRSPCVLVIAKPGCQEESGGPLGRSAIRDVLTQYRATAAPSLLRFWETLF